MLIRPNEEERIRERLFAARGAVVNGSAPEISQEIVSDLLCSLTHLDFGATHPQLVGNVCAMLKRGRLEEAAAAVVVAVDGYRSTPEARRRGASGEPTPP